MPNELNQVIRLMNQNENIMNFVEISSCDRAQQQPFHFILYFTFYGKLKRERRKKNTERNTDARTSITFVQDWIHQIYHSL